MDKVSTVALLSVIFTYVLQIMPMDLEAPPTITAGAFVDVLNLYN
jgi:hypothetical protein